MNREPRPRYFRSMTLNVGTRRMRTMVITMSLMIAVLFLFICAIAVQLMAANNQHSLASRVLHSVSNQSLNSIMGQEIPVYASADPKQIGKPPESRSKWTSLLFYLFTDIDVDHPETMLGGSIAAMSVSNFEPLTEDSKESPGEDIPPADMGKPQPQPPTEQPEPVPSNGKPIVYIYHSHNREAYLPELNNVKEFNQAYDKDKNITLAGERLVKDLKEKKIESIQTKTDYWVPGKFEESYDFSRKTVQEVLSKNNGIRMVFDIHRDSLARQFTTAKWNGQDVARVSFIVGGMNPNSKKNEEFAKQVHKKMQELYPGVSKGAFTKKDNRFDTRYNQDLHPKSIIIEIGGPENTMEEVYRTTDLLSNVITELAKEGQNAK
ncbi:stage II sporulation protein P [Effusibacillus consociatus]|uniref:Stage II sporulation protein P n=1 Tax=Effusibacillus consociatus TaxID=1117041 RepID=A0ABV9PWD1_9BACL